MSDDFIARLPRHEAGLTLEHNPHRNYYETVEEWTKDRKPDWPSDEEKAKAIASGDVWVLQWFPDTPVGSYTCAASTLDALLDYCQDDETVVKS